MRLLIDLDEVLVDFVGGCLQAHGWTRDRLLQTWQPGTWSIVEPMGMTEVEWEAPIKELGEAFWTNLQPHPWADELLKLVRRLTDDWLIVTCPSTFGAAARLGKTKWLRNYFGPAFDRFSITSDKHRYAAKDAILVDDREETVKRFTLVGGIGQVFPAYNNSLHAHRHDPVGYITPALEQLCGS